MEQKCVVSVIIPVYNVAPYLAEALDSVINQSYEELEIIVIDDGSTDGSCEICDKYAEQDNRIRLIHQVNQGVAAARNTALDNVTGDVIAFLDSDDAYDPDYVKIMLAAMNDSGADVVICKYSKHFTTEKMSGDNIEEIGQLINGGIYDRIYAMRALASNKIHAYLWNKLFRARLWAEIRFPIGMVYEDIDVIFRVFNLCDKILVLDQPLYMYRKRHGSITEQKSTDSISDWLAICIRIESFVNENIPDVYTSDDLKNMKQLRLYNMISYFCKHVLQKTADSKAFMKSLRKQIIELKKEVGLGKCSVRMRISYRIIQLCPGLLKVLSPVYMAFKKTKYLGS